MNKACTAIRRKSGLTVILTLYCIKIRELYKHADVVPPNDEGDFPTPWVDKAGPAGVEDDVLSIPNTEPDG